MKIQFKTLAQFAKVGDLKMSISTIQHIVHRSYCGPMTVKGMCKDCRLCASPLNNAFRLEGARNKEAFLTYRLKDAVAANQETFFKKPVIMIKLDRFGLPVSEDPLKDITGELDKEIERREHEAEAAIY